MQAGLAALRGLPKLQVLDLTFSRIPAKACGAIGSLPRLADLSVIESSISDDGLAILAAVGASALTRLNAVGCCHLTKWCASRPVSGICMYAFYVNDQVVGGSVEDLSCQSSIS